MFCTPTFSNSLTWAVLLGSALASPLPTSQNDNAVLMNRQDVSAAALCNNGGTNWAVWPSSAYNSNPSYPAFRCAEFKTVSPAASGALAYAGGILEPNEKKTINVYNSGYTHTAAFLALTHTGYIYGVEAGTYKFAFENIDDGLWLWVGALAYKGWKRGNQDLVLNAASVNDGDFSYEVKKGEYVPFRAMFGSAQGNTDINIKITAPSGTVILDSNTKVSEYIVRNSCDGTTAPKFLPWGQEQ